MCPECGSPLPAPIPRDTEQVRTSAAKLGVRCRHCGRPLSEMVDGACACGATYQLSALPEPGRPRARAGATFIDAIAVFAAILGAGLGLVLMLVSGVVKAKLPPLGPVLLACAPMFTLVLLTAGRSLFRRMPEEAGFLATGFLVVVGVVCLVAATASL